MSSINHRTVVGAVIFRDERVLIIKRSAKEAMLPNVWELPSGKKKAFESVKKALLREILEETNLTNVKIIRPISVFEYTSNDGTDIKDRVQITYLAESGEGDIHLSCEHQDYAWITLKDINRYRMTDQIKQVIREGYTAREQATDK